MKAWIDNRGIINISAENNVERMAIKWNQSQWPLTEGCGGVLIHEVTPSPAPKNPPKIDNDNPRG